MSSKAMASKNMPPLPESFGPIFFRNQFRTQIELPTKKQYPDVEGTTAIITGSNTGLGFAAARQCLMLGVTVLIMGVRSIEKGEQAAGQLRKEFHEPDVQVWALNMDSYDSIQHFVGRCRSLSRIDAVILNAGIGPSQFSVNATTGHESTMQVNHFSTALLALLFVPLLKEKKRSTVPTITVVNSVTAQLCKFPNRNQRPILPSFDDTQITPFDGEERYGVSKLISQIFMVQLAEKVSVGDVLINMVDPGLTKGTNLARDLRGWQAVAAKAFFGIAGRPVEKGAATYIHAAFNAGPDSHGCFLMNEQIAPLSKWYYSEGDGLRDAVWNETLADLKSKNINLDVLPI